MIRPPNYLARDPKVTRAAVLADRQRARTDRRMVILDRVARVPLDVTPSRVVCLVGCGKAKALEAGAARDMYTSPLFRKSLELGELVADATFVVSAAKGLLELDEKVTAYDLSLRTKPLDWREDWGRSVIRELALRTFVPTTRLRVVLMMGETYAAPIIAAIEERRSRLTCWAPPVDLMHGMMIGDRLAFLNRAIKLARGAR